jgi:predicted transcriptional regulator
MEVHLKPETQSRLDELASRSGRPASELLEDAMAGYLTEVTQVRTTLDRRYDDVNRGWVKPIDGGEALARLRGKNDLPRS